MFKRLGCTLSFLLTTTLVQASSDTVKIGILTDMSGVMQDSSGPGSVTAAEMAVADFGGKILGKPVQVLNADHQMKPDVASAIARGWFDSGVDAVFDLPLSTAAQAVVELARSRKKITVVNNAAAAEITGPWCSPYNVHWVEDTRALAVVATEAQVALGNDTWFYVTTDVAFGKALVRDSTRVLNERGGKVVGEARFPTQTSDFSSFFLAAQTSPAKVIALSAAGNDNVNAIKQAQEFQITKDKELISFVVYLTDVYALGLDGAHGISLAAGFYWDQNDSARAFSDRFFAKMRAMPTKAQAGVYASVLHYLRSIEAAGTVDGEMVSKRMRELPIDFFGRQGSIRTDGRAVYDLSLYKVKDKSESKRPWDYYKEVRVISGSVAFADPKENGCYLNK